MAAMVVMSCIVAAVGLAKESQSGVDMSIESVERAWEWCKPEQ